MNKGMETKFLNATFTINFFFGGLGRKQNNCTL